MKIGVIGGTFDPVHYGHLILADRAAEYLELPKVLFIPSNMPPHKDLGKITPVRHRIEMLRLAIENNDIFELSTVECDRDGMSYSYETFGILHEMFGEDTDFYFIVGSDVLFDLASFKNFDILSKSCSFAVAVRSGANTQELRAVSAKLSSEYGARIIHVPYHEIDISSTIIREKVTSGESVRYMLPDTVRNYIRENGLYMV